MRTAGLPTFTKLWGRNDTAVLRQGTYLINVTLSTCRSIETRDVNLTYHWSDYPVESYHGTKSIVISTVSWIGGKNPFLGWAYVASAALFVGLAIAGTIRHMIKPRYVGSSLQPFGYVDHHSYFTENPVICLFFPGIGDHFRMLCCSIYTFAACILRPPLHFRY